VKARAEANAETVALVPLTLLPWHQGARSRLETAVAGERLPHALLLHGPEGVGKERFAAVLAAALFCSRRAAALHPLRECAELRVEPCRLAPGPALAAHPRGQEVDRVDAVREACEQLGMTSMRSGYRVAIVAPAHAMTTNAQKRVA